MTITLTREEAQSVLDALSGCREDSEELFYDYKQKYGDHYKPQRITFQQSVLDQSGQAIETLRARIAHPEDIYEEGCTPADFRVLREANARMAHELFELRSKK